MSYQYLSLVSLLWVYSYVMFSAAATNVIYRPRLDAAKLGHRLTIIHFSRCL